MNGWEITLVILTLGLFGWVILSKKIRKRNIEVDMELNKINVKLITVDVIDSKLDKLLKENEKNKKKSSK